MRRITLLCIIAAAAGLPVWAAETCASADKDGGWIALFDGDNLDAWQHARMPLKENTWFIEDGTMTNKDHGNDIGTKQKFKDFELKLEYKIVKGGNSGVYLRGRVEVQILDSHGKGNAGPRDNGALYDKVAPLVNASIPAGEWNTLEARYVGDVLDVTLNGKVIHKDLRVTEVTGGALPGGLNDPGPLMIQGDHGKIWVRNVMIRPLDKPNE